MSLTGDPTWPQPLNMVMVYGCPPEVPRVPDNIAPLITPYAGLVPCPLCGRHVRGGIACPFCWANDGGAGAEMADVRARLDALEAGRGAPVRKALEDAQAALVVAQTAVADAMAAVRHALGDGQTDQTQGKATGA
jgi:hypothetical protein